MKRLENISKERADELLNQYATELKDLYRSPRDYQRWNTVLAELLILSGIVIGPQRTAEIIAKDSVSAMAMLTAHFVLSSECPTRYLSAEIGEAFLQTELPLNIPEPLLPYPAMVLMLPKGLLNAEDGRPIDAIHIADHHSLTAYARQHFGGTIKHPTTGAGLRIIAVTSAGECFGSIYYWANPEENAAREIVTEIKGEQITSVLHRIDRLAINAWLTMSYQPELVSQGDTPPSSSAATGRTPSGKKVPMAPTWIGWNYKRIVRSRSLKRDLPTGRSMRMHWRVGCWRCTPCGPKRQQRRMVWIKPVLVNAYKAWDPG
jgi:hypothetical protein